MYNRYTGNTGRFVRVEDGEPVRRGETENARPEHRQENEERRAERAESRPVHKQHQGKKLLDLTALGEKLGLGNLSPLLGKLDTSDILLIAILLLTYLEKKDEDILIMLSALVFFSLQ